MWTGTYGPGLGPAKLAAMLASLERDKHRSMPPDTGGRCLCAIADGKLAGTVIRGERKQTACVWGMHVGLNQQRSGIGSRLLLAAADAPTTASRLEVCVLATSPWAIAFCRKYGFAVVGTRHMALLDDDGKVETLALAVEARALVTRASP